MALTQEDLEQLGGFIDGRIKAALPAELSPEEQAASEQKDYQRQAGRPDVDPEAGPEYYVHLANGDVITTHDSGATHMEVDGESVLVIGRYQKLPEGAVTA
jgi:hypothetical protein